MGIPTRRKLFHMIERRNGQAFWEHSQPAETLLMKSVASKIPSEVVGACLPDEFAGQEPRAGPATVRNGRVNAHGHCLRLASAARF